MKNFLILILVLMLISVCIISWIQFNIYEKDITKMTEDAEVRRTPIEKVVTKNVYIEKEVYWYQFQVTGYSPDDPNQGTTRIMASGKEVYEGAVAVDPKVIPLGTKLEIRGLLNGKDGIYYAEDTGGKVIGLRVDIFYENYFDALQVNQMVWVRFLEEE